MHDLAIIGGGILGLTSALALQRRRPGARLLVLEKEEEWARHQSGRNSGVLHSGVYYPPGSLKARLTWAGRRAMLDFCGAHGLPCAVTGKLIVAAEERERAALERLHARGTENGLSVRLLSAAEAREREPHVRAAAAVHVPEAGVVDFRRVAAKCAELLAEGGADLRRGTRLLAARDGVLETDRGDFEAGFVVSCAGLHSDRVARLFGVRAPARIVPFRGEYRAVARPELVRTMVYPVPDPAFPFLGVHLTRGIDGALHAGPNAVLALSREGYRRGDADWRDLRETLLYGGFWRFAGRHVATGVREMLRRRSFLRSVQRLVPDVRAEDLSPAPSGVRAQALDPRGRLVDDFLFAAGPRSLHVLNAPSPAATAAFAIAEEIADRVCMQSR